MSAAGFQLRALTPADVEPAVRLLSQLGYPSSPAAVETRIRRAAAAQVESVAAEAGDGRLIGLASMHRMQLLSEDGPVAVLTSLVVDEHARGSGVGRALVEWMCAHARELGCARITLTTHLRRSDAHAFYEKLGFEFTGRRYVRRLGAP
jgi:GNAT superfamily N-acetyltransferase